MNKIEGEIIVNQEQIKFNNTVVERLNYLHESIVFLEKQFTRLINTLGKSNVKHYMD